MAIVYDMGSLDRYMRHAVTASPEHPILIDKFLEDATEIDVDALADASGAVVIGGIMEHIEQAGIHSGDSSCVVPPFQLSDKHVATIREYTRRVAQALNVVGLMNTQFAGERRDRLRAGGQPARLANDSVSVQGYRDATGESGGPADDWPDLGGPRSA
jgi:carbamoylphosphate synthase large subunit